VRRTGLSVREARAVTLAAQGFAASDAGVTAAGLRALIGRLGALQIDSVNVLVRSHYLPAFSRFGPYDRSMLERVAYGKPRRVFEYWGHEASYLPMDLFPAMRWRMRQSREGTNVWRGVALVGRERRELVKRVRSEVEARGPLSASDLEDAKNRESWWGWSDTKRAMEFLYWCGEVTPVKRRSSFERVYDLTERAIPQPYVSQDMADADAFARLVERAARAFGVASETDLRDYFRLPVLGARNAVRRLTEEGVLHPVRVEGWKGDAYLHRDARKPRAVNASALLSPFDSLVWNRARTHRLFDFHYRIEIYTPAHKRVHGYYVLPYLLDGNLVARVDAKADRAASTLRVPAVHLEPGASKREVMPRLRGDLRAMASWLELERMTIAEKSRTAR